MKINWKEYSIKVVSYKNSWDIIRVKWSDDIERRIMLSDGGYKISNSEDGSNSSEVSTFIRN